MAKLKIRKAIKRPGALRRKFEKWFGLKPGQKIPRAMYSKGYRRAKKSGDTRTMRQIDFARTIQGLAKRARKRKKVRRRK